MNGKLRVPGPPQNKLAGYLSQLGLCNLANSVSNSGWVCAVSLETNISYPLGHNEKEEEENQDSGESYLKFPLLFSTEEQGKPTSRVKDTYINVNGNKVLKISRHSNQQ